MMNHITMEVGRYGPRAIVSGVTSDHVRKSLIAEGIAELELNDGRGWHGHSLEFLQDLPQLRSLTIIDLTIPSVEPIHCLSQLVELSVVTYCKSEIRFAAFPHLEACNLEWRPRALSLFKCTTVKKVTLNRYDGMNTEPFGRLCQLESLALLNAAIRDLHGLGPLAKLRALRLANVRRLPSLAGVEQLTMLEELDIHSCPRINSIEELRALQRLRVCQLNNCGSIASLRPLADLADLEFIAFYESTNILDGDLSPLLRHNNLSRISFQNRRHYSHRREDFGAAYSE